MVMINTSHEGTKIKLWNKQKTEQKFPISSHSILSFNHQTLLTDFHVLITVLLMVNKYADKQIINMNVYNLGKETYKKINKANAMW